MEGEEHPYALVRPQRDLLVRAFDHFAVRSQGRLHDDVPFAAAAVLHHGLDDGFTARRRPKAGGHHRGSRAAARRRGESKAGENDGASPHLPGTQGGNSTTQTTAMRAASTMTVAHPRLATGSARLSLRWIWTKARGSGTRGIENSAA